MIWPDDAQLPFLTAQMAKRLPARVLLLSRETRRHEKAVDNDTGDVIGYARWILPERFKGEWLDAIVEDVGEEKRKELDMQADEAWWKPGEHEGAVNTDVLDEEIGKARDRAMKELEERGTGFIGELPAGPRCVMMGRVDAKILDRARLRGGAP